MSRPPGGPADSSGRGGGEARAARRGAGSAGWGDGSGSNDVFSSRQRRVGRLFHDPFPRRKLHELLFVILASCGCKRLLVNPSTFLNFSLASAQSSMYFFHTLSL